MSELGQNHTVILLNSLDKIYKLSRLTGKIKTVDLSLINIIYKLLNHPNMTLCDKDVKKLNDLYIKLTYSSDIICSEQGYISYNNNFESPFYQAEPTDINEFFNIFTNQFNNIFL